MSGEVKEPALLFHRPKIRILEDGRRTSEIGIGKDLIGKLFISGKLFHANFLAKKEIRISSIHFIVFVPKKEYCC